MACGARSNTLRNAGFSNWNCCADLTLKVLDARKCGCVFESDVRAGHVHLEMTNVHILALVGVVTTFPTTYNCTTNLSLPGLHL